MKKYISFWFAIVLTWAILIDSVATFALSQTDIHEEFRIRGGLGNFLQRAHSGDSLNIAYLGGSITRQEGWRKYSFEWFQDRFPNTHFHQIHAAIGGTGSDFGAYRLTAHVLTHKPDLVFVEFAVNDNGKPEEKILQAMEGIVRQIWNHNPSTDICFVYTTMARFLETEQRGELPPSKLAMEKVAEYYNIPSIDFGPEIAKRISDNTLLYTGEKSIIDGIKVFSTDGVHPYNDTGQRIYHEVFSRSFEKLILHQKQMTSDRELPEYMYPNPLLETNLTEIQDSMLEGNWQKIDVESVPAFSGFRQHLKYLYKASSEKESLRFQFKGTDIGAYDVMGPDAGRLIVEVDGEVKDTIYRFDAYCTYHRMNYFILDNLEDKVHEVVFRPFTGPFDKEAILRKRNEQMQKPEDYAEYNWYIGRIMVNGQILP